MTVLNIKSRIIEKTFSKKRWEKNEPSKYLSRFLDKIYLVLREGLKIFKCIKFQIHLKTILEKKNYLTNSIEQEITVYFVSEMKQVFHEDDIFEYLRSCFDEIVNKFDVFLSNGSGYVLQKIVNLRVLVVKIKNTLIGGSYKPYLPSVLRKKRALLNIPAPPGYCFGYSIAACLSNLPSNTRFKNYTRLVRSLKFNRKWIRFSELGKFEKKNKIRLNVFSYDITSGNISFLFKSKNNNDKICNLLLFDGHYYCIKNLRRLGYDRRKTTSNQFFCQFCFTKFTKETALANHNKVCGLEIKQNITTNAKGTSIHFSRFDKVFRYPFVHYLDFESILIPMDRVIGNSTNLIEKHYPISAGIIRVCKLDENKSSIPRFFHGENVIDELWEYLDQELVEMKKYLDVILPMKFSTIDQIRYDVTTKCDLCMSDFGSMNKKTRDHCHLTGKFRYVLCNKCNLTHGRMRLKPTIICHNLSSYDSHLLISNLRRAGKIHRIIPKNSEKYLSFSIDEWTFLDSMAFLPSSLQKLTDSLKSEGLEFFRETKKFAGSNANFTYLLGKLPYPYSYAKKLEDYFLPSLPSKNDFKDNLKDSNISEKEYQFAKRIFRKFKCKTFLDYHKLYCLTDITLLADVFERYRDLVFDQYSLECLAYVSAPQLAFDGMLRLSNERIECLPDMSMVHFLQKNIRGGICVSSKKYSQANNKYLPNYDESKPSKFITYLDANNLYGYIMLNEKMPYSHYKWLTLDEIEKIDFLNIDVTGSKGYILECDIDYPPWVQDKTVDYPLACEKLCVKDDLLSPYSLDLRKKLNLTASKIYKNIPNLMNKKKYVLHFANLQYYLKSGMKLTKIYRVLQFRQKNFLHDFVENNLQRRKEAISPFLSFYFKLQLNSIFGKFLQRKDLEINLHIVQSEEMFDRYVSSPLFTGLRIFDNNLIGISCLKPKIIMDRPVGVGFSILEKSKIHMHRFYDTITGLYKKDKKKIELLYTDTDSFIFEIQTEDLYEDFIQIKDHMDFSNYDSSHMLFSDNNKLREGKFKDEIPPIQNNIPSEFIGLKAKLYSIKTQSEEIKRAKGINTTSITFKDYSDALFNSINISTDLKSIRSLGHKLYTIKIRKSGLHSYDDKRYFFDGIHSYGLGYHKTKLIEIID